MNTPKTFEPVVTEDMLDSYLSCAGEIGDRKAGISAALAHPDFQRQLRAYAAEVARAMVPEERTMSTFSSVACSHVWEDCRAATLSAIDEWEKGE